MRDWFSRPGPASSTQAAAGRCRKRWPWRQRRSRQRLRAELSRRRTGRRAPRPGVGPRARPSAGSPGRRGRRRGSASPRRPSRRAPRPGCPRLGSWKTVEPLDPCWPRFSAPLVENTRRPRRCSRRPARVRRGPPHPVGRRTRAGSAAARSRCCSWRRGGSRPGRSATGFTSHRRPPTTTSSTSTPRSASRRVPPPPCGRSSTTSSADSAAILSGGGSRISGIRDQTLALAGLRFLRPGSRWRLSSARDPRGLTARPGSGSVADANGPR